MLIKLVVWMQKNKEKDIYRIANVSITFFLEFPMDTNFPNEHN